MNKILFKWFLGIFFISLVICNFENICLFTDYRFFLGHLAEAKEIESEYIDATYKEV